MVGCFLNALFACCGCYWQTKALTSVWLTKMIVVGILFKRTTAAKTVGRMAFQNQPSRCFHALGKQQHKSSRAITFISSKTQRHLSSKKDFLSFEDAMEQNQANGNRPFPPVLDGQLDDNEGFGAYTYDPNDPVNIAEFEEPTALEQIPVSFMTVDDRPNEQRQKGEEVVVFQQQDISPVEPAAPTTPEIHRAPDFPIDTHIHAGLMAEAPADAGSTANDDAFLERASFGTGVSTTVDMLKYQREELVKTIFELNGGQEFNLNSPRQISQALFGNSESSTNKDALEMLAGRGNQIADAIIRYRKLSSDIKRMDKKKELREKGMFVRSAVEAFQPNKSKPEVSVIDDSSKSLEGDAAAFTAGALQSTTASSPDVEDDIARGDPLLLVDASAYIFRAYYSMPPLHRGDGMPVGAVMGFCNMLNRLVLNRLLEGESPRLVLVFDSKGKNFRHEMYHPYKANRPEAPMDLIPQFALIREAALAYGIHQLEAPAFEADDVIATLATMAKDEGIDVHILSGDKDLMQLITPENVVPCIHMIDPMSMSRITHNVVFEKWGISPDKLGDVLALTGDSADNVPGVPGIGPKGASALIQEFGSLDQLLENLEQVKHNSRREKLQNNLEQAKLSRKLIELERNIPVQLITFPPGFQNVSDLHMEPLNGDRLLTFYDQMGFRDLKRRLQGRLLQLDRVKKSKKKFIPRRPKAEIPTPDDYKDVPF